MRHLLRSSAVLILRLGMAPEVQTFENYGTRILRGRVSVILTSSGNLPKFLKIVGSYTVQKKVVV